MSTDADLVLDAIANGARDRAAIAELTGLEVQPVSNHMTALKAKGLIERSDAGWVTTGASAKPPATRRINGNTRECEFAIAESGAVLFKVTQGPKAGEMGHINHVDAMALYRLMDACDFIRENA